MVEKIHVEAYPDDRRKIKLLRIKLGLNNTPDVVHILLEYFINREKLKGVDLNNE